jgi:hypothetical protein
MIDTIMSICAVTIVIALTVGLVGCVAMSFWMIYKVITDE